LPSDAHFLAALEYLIYTQDAARRESVTTPQPTKLSVRKPLQPPSQLMDAGNGKWSNAANARIQSSARRQFNSGETPKRPTSTERTARVPPEASCGTKHYRAVEISPRSIRIPAVPRFV